MSTNSLLYSLTCSSFFVLGLYAESPSISITPTADPAEISTSLQSLDTILDDPLCTEKTPEELEALLPPQQEVLVQEPLVESATPSESPSTTPLNPIADTSEKEEPSETIHAEKMATPASCGRALHPMTITARHIEGGGIGYREGYSTLEGFLTPIHPYKDTWIPFLDLRGHIFNDGKMAANAGMGLRYLTHSRIWGVNTYYDYRNTKKQHYNQVAVGLESLGHIWDFRINGYLPVGVKTSHFYNTQFDHFEDNHMILSRKRQFALKGANAEVGAHVDSIKNLPLYFAAGPYYLEGQGRVAWGGELRASVMFHDYIRLEGNTSYDNLFHWVGQGQISLIWPFGGKREVKQGKSRSCSQALALSHRAIQRVDRNEIIPVGTQHKQSVAINPATGEPYFFWFVDNTSHSAGTIESPFPTLLAAQNASSAGDIIYVFPGDGTDQGMNQGIVLKASQSLLGSAIEHAFDTTVGMVTVPAQTQTFPYLTDSGGMGTEGIVMLNNDNVVSGLIIETVDIGAVSKISVYGGEGITNAEISRNFLISSTPRDSYSLVILPSTQIGNLLITNNLFSSALASNQEACFLDGLSNGVVTVSGNTIQGTYLEGVEFAPQYNLCSQIVNNTVTTGNRGIYVHLEAEKGPFCLDLSGNSAIAELVNSADPSAFTLASFETSNQGPVTMAGPYVSGSSGPRVSGVFTLTESCSCSE